MNLSPSQGYTTTKESLFDSSLYNTKIANFYFVALIGLFLLSIATVRFMIADVPVRVIYAVALFGLVYITRPELLITAVKETFLIWMIILYAACLGLIVSLYNNLNILEVIRQIFEIHIQAIVGLLAGYGLLHIMGARKLVLAFVIVVLCSGFVAFLQFLDLSFAWNIREALQSIQKSDIERIFLTQRLRSMGLSYSPVHLGTQICLAFAVIFVFLKGRSLIDKQDIPVLIVFSLLGLFILIAIFSGNRSPILGFGVFLSFYLLMTKPVFSIGMGVLVLPLLILAYSQMDMIVNFLQDTGIRAFRVGDKSSVGREALRDYGWLLFKSHPLGYGLIFDSRELVPQFWDQMASYENAETIKGNAPHNFYVNMTHKYGVFILFLGTFCAFKFIKNYTVLIGFLAYAVHIFFHNDGPLYGDFMIWYFVPMVMAVIQIKKQQKAIIADA